MCERCTACLLLTVTFLVDMSIDELPPLLVIELIGVNAVSLVRASPMLYVIVRSEAA